MVKIRASTTKVFILRREPCHITNVTNAGVTTQIGLFHRLTTSPQKLWSSSLEKPGLRMTLGGWAGHCHLTAVEPRRGSCDMQEAATTYTFPLLPPLESSPSDSSPVTELTTRRRRRGRMKGKKRRGGHSICFCWKRNHIPPLTFMYHLQSDSCISLWFTLI